MNKLHGSINIYDPENTGSLFKYKENIEGITHEGLKNLISKINNLFKDKSKKQIQSLYFEGKEVVDSVIDSKKSVVWQQAQNRMYVQQSILNYCIAWLKKWLGWKQNYL